MRRRIVAAALVGLFACIRPTDQASEGGLSLQFDASAAAWDSVRVLVRGPTNKTVKVTPGTTVTIDGLIPGMYTIALQAFDSGGIASIFQTTSVSVVANANASLTPTATQFVPFVPAITSLPATGTSTTFTVGFSGVTGAASYEVEAATNAAFTTNRVAVATTATSAQVTVPSFGTYYVRVRAIDAYDGRGRASSSQTIQLAGIPPAAPSGLTANGVSTNQIDLSWTDNATNEDGFQIERCTGASCSSFTQIATVGPNITAYSNAGLTPSASYSYRVRAYNTAASSAYTNTATASTSAIVTLPAAPSDLSVSVVSNSQLNLSWTDNSNNEDGFQIERCTGSSCANFTQITTVGPNVTTYSDAGLAASTSYRYRVRAYNTAGGSSYSNIATGTTVATVTLPAAPSSLTASAVSNSQINLSWTDNANNEDGFLIERCTGSSCSSFTPVTTTGPNVTTYSDGGLAASTNYRYRVRAYNTAGFSAFSNTATATTAATVTIPAAPSSLTASTVSNSQINLSWTDNSNNEDGFQIERCTGASCGSFALIGSVGPNVTTFSDAGLTASTSYSYRVRASNAAGSSAPSNTAAATTGATLPAAPSSLTATAVSSSQIDLSWTDNATNENGVQIERCTGASCANFAQIATVGPNVTTYSNSTGLSASTSYNYRVRAYNAAGSSAPSNTAPATTFLAPPAAPSSLSASTVSSAQINLSWADNANNEDGFLIERCTGASCTSFAQVATVGPNVTAYQNTGLAAGTSYSYRVRANNTAGNSAYSNTATATTTVTLPAAPLGLTATAISSSQINLGWADNATNEDGFQIERCTGASCSNFTQIATVGPNVTAYSNTTGLAASTSYNYRVRANNTAGNSAYSNTATATTLVGPPSAPSSLSATPVSTSRINLSWNDNSNNEDGFRIERCTGSSCGNFTQIQTVGPNATTYADEAGLTPATTYRYRVLAFNSGGVSGYSSTANATTLPTPPAAPTLLPVTSETSSRITLNWLDNSNNESGFEIERCTGATCTNFVEISTSLGPNVTSYNNTGLSGKTTYSYRMYAYNAGGPSAYSNTVTGTTD